MKTKSELLLELEAATRESMLAYMQDDVYAWMASDEWKRFKDADYACRTAGIPREDMKATIERAEEWAIREANGENDGYYDR